MQNMIEILERRLIGLERRVKDTQCPGEMDEYELEETIGRIKELKFVIELIKGEKKVICEDKIYCASPNCTGKCGRQITDEIKKKLIRESIEASFACLCDLPDDVYNYENKEQ